MYKRPYSCQKEREKNNNQKTLIPSSVTARLLPKYAVYLGCSKGFLGGLPFFHVGNHRDEILTGGSWWLARTGGLARTKPIGISCECPPVVLGLFTG